MKNRIAIFPGTFDPPTLGHMDIISRSAKLYDKLYVVVGDNVKKNRLFSAMERKAFLEKELGAFDNVEVAIWDGLTVDFARQFKASVMIRGLRSMNDFNYEFELALTNRMINDEIETVFIAADPKLFLVSSSAIKEMAKFNVDFSSLVPQSVYEAMINKEKVLT